MPRVHVSRTATVATSRLAEHRSRTLANVFPASPSNEVDGPCAAATTTLAPGGAHLKLHREVACAILIDPQGRYLLQRRDNDPNIIYPGRIGLFGGHREGGETFLECVVREVYEETGYLANPQEFELLGSYSGPDREIPEATVVGHYYVLRSVPVEALNITEGSLLIVEPEKLNSLAPEIAPAATTAFRMLFRRE